MELQSLLGTSINCRCGRRHSVPIRTILIGNGVLRQVGDAVADALAVRRALIVVDKTTWGIAGQATADSLAARGFAISTCLVGGESGTAHADEAGLGQVLAACTTEIDVLVAVGSGSISDLTRMVAARTGRPFVVVATAPSMDGYTSSVAPISIRGFKRTFPAVPPIVVVADLDILSQAPAHMIAAGYGDLLGKFTAQSDWILARAVQKEHYCPYVVELLEPVLDFCLAYPEKVRARNRDAIRLLTEGLMFSGIAILMVGLSRPASGGEHHLAHFWEMEFLTKGEAGPLHGEKVGLATPLIARIWQRLAEHGLPVAHWSDLYRDEKEYSGRMQLAFGPLAGEIITANRPRLGESSVASQQQLNWSELLTDARRDLPSPEKLRKALANAGGQIRAEQLGISRDSVARAIRHAREVRQRYGVLELAAEAGLLDGWVDDLVDEFY